MNLGVKFSSNLPIDITLKLAKYAESAGYSSIWTTNNETSMQRDALTRITAIATLTKRVTLGTAVINPFTRNPTLIAISSAVIDELSKGRFILGLGAGPKRALENQGVRFVRPLKRLEECTHLVRELWTGKRVTFKGETMELTDVQMAFKPLRERIPVYFGVTGEKAIELAARVSDGMVLNSYTSADYASRAIRARGRRKDVRVLGNIMVSMDEDADAAIKGVLPSVYTHLTRFPWISKANAVPSALVNELIDLEKREGTAESYKHVPERLVKELAAVGGVEDCIRWIRRYMQTGLDEGLVTPIHGDPRRVLRGISTLVAD